MGYKLHAIAAVFGARRSHSDSGEAPSLIAAMAQNLRPIAGTLILLCAASAVRAETAVSLYGITLDQPLGLPTCAVRTVGDMYVYDDLNNQVTCAMRQWQPPGTDDDGGEWVEVHYAPPGPSLLKGEYVSVWVYGGNVQDIMILTGGVDMQAEILNELVEKFGKTSSTYYESVQNRMGAQFQVVHARWQIGGSNIRFAGAVDELDSGELEAQTQLGAKMRSEEKARIGRATPSL